LTLRKSPSVLELRHFGGLGGGLFVDVGGRPFLPVEHRALDCYFDNILGGSAVGSEVLGARFGPVGEVLLLRFFFDGVLKFLEDIELFELGVPRHSKLQDLNIGWGIMSYTYRIYMSIEAAMGISRGAQTDPTDEHSPVPFKRQKGLLGLLFPSAGYERRNGNGDRLNILYFLFD
jgi:hypothetical protein